MKCKNRIVSPLLGVFFCLVFLSNCASNKPRVVFVPAGVDSTTAMIADSIAQQLFVDWQSQELARRKADSAQVLLAGSEELLAALQTKEEGGNVAPEDTLEAIKKYNEAADSFIAASQTANDSTLSVTKQKELVGKQLHLAVTSLEEAVVLNPFDRQTHTMLARAYQKLAGLHAQDQYWGRAAEIFTKLVHMDAGQHSFFGNLASCYMRLGVWNKAVENFAIAESVLLESAVFQVPPDQPLNDQTIAAAIDSATYFTYVYNQAYANARLFREEETFRDLRRARILARDEENAELVQGLYDWGMWDDGKLETADKRDSILVYIDRGQFELAARESEILLPNLRTNRARQEINWRLAILEYARLKRPDDAINRMKRIIEFYEHDTTGLAQQDTMLSQYKNAYGSMCYNIGSKAKDVDRDQRLALAYFMQAVSISWPGEAKAHLGIADLIRNNAQQSVDAAKMAYELRHQLSGNELCAALELIVDGLRRQRKIAEATRYFEEYRQCQGQN